MDTAQVNYYQEQVEIKEQLYQNVVTVEFGSPRKNCQGLGICRIEAADSILSKSERCFSCQPNNTVLAVMSFLLPKQIELSVLQSTLHRSCRKKHFSSKYFTMEEAYTLPFALTDLLVDKAMTIKKGRYPILQCNETFITVRMNFF